MHDTDARLRMTAGVLGFGAMSNLLSGIDVLLVDDDPDASAFVEIILSGEGANVRVATSVAEAIRALDAGHPSLVLGDISLPDADGFVLLKELRARDAALPVVALTGYASKTDVKRSTDAGFDHHLSKPVDLDDLVAAVFRFARRAPTNA